MIKCLSKASLCLGMLSSGTLVGSLLNLVLNPDTEMTLYALKISSGGLGVSILVASSCYLYTRYYRPPLVLTKPGDTIDNR